jgi:hypothetical protein
MPLESGVSDLNRTNTVNVMLRAFRSNAVVKALIFMPGATDELYMFRRVKADLTNAAPTLLDAARALTRRTPIRVTFRPPMLLVHSEEDSLEPLIKVEHQRTADRLHQADFLPVVLYIDRDWDSLQPICKRTLKLDLRPWRYTIGSWHFYRHTFAAWGLSGWEALEAMALAGKSGFIVRRGQVIFIADRRLGPTPHLEHFPQE